MGSTETPEPPPAGPSELTQTIELVSRAKRGDAGALDELSARYYDRVRRVVRRKLSARLRKLLESTDVVQETFRNAVCAFDRFEMRDERSFINWLAKIAERTITGFHDGFAAERRRLLDRGFPLGGSDLDPARAVADPGPGVTTRVTLEEDVGILRKCIDELPATYRDLIILRDYQGLSWQEVAKRLGKPTADAARVCHAPAIAALQKAVLRRVGINGHSRNRSDRE